MARNNLPRESQEWVRQLEQENARQATAISQLQLQVTNLNRALFGQGGEVTFGSLSRPVEFEVALTAHSVNLPNINVAAPSGWPKLATTFDLPEGYNFVTLRASGFIGAFNDTSPTDAIAKIYANAYLDFYNSGNSFTSYPGGSTNFTSVGSGTSAIVSGAARYGIAATAGGVKVPIPSGYSIVTTGLLGGYAGGGSAGTITNGTMSLSGSLVFTKE